MGACRFWVILGVKWWRWVCPEKTVVWGGGGGGRLRLTAMHEWMQGHDLTLAMYASRHVSQKLHCVRTPVDVCLLTFVSCVVMTQGTRRWFSRHKGSVALPKHHVSVTACSAACSRHRQHTVAETVQHEHSMSTARSACKSLKAWHTDCQGCQLMSYAVAQHHTLAVRHSVTAVSKPLQT